MDAPQLKCMARADLIDTHVLCWLVIHVLSAGCVCVQFISDLLLSSKLIGCDYWPFPISDLDPDSMIHLSGKLIRLRAFCCVARSVLLNVQVAPIISPTSRIVKRQAP